MIARTCLVGGVRVRLLQHRAGGTAVLLVHGNSSCKEIFSKQIPALRDGGFSIVVPDLPGHGESDDSRTPSSTYSFPGYARTLLSLMKRLGYAAFHVVGWSLGGHIGIEMWASDRAVRSLLLTGTPPVRLDPSGVAAGFRWTATTALAGRSRFASDDVTRYVRAMMGTSPALGGYFDRMAARTDGRARKWMVTNGLAGRGIDQLKAVSEINRPLGVVQGIHDPFVRMDYIRSIFFKNVWTGAPVEIEAGHAPHWERPKAFNSKMMEFLMDRISSGGQPGGLGTNGQHRGFHRQDA